MASILSPQKILCDIQCAGASAAGLILPIEITSGIMHAQNTANTAMMSIYASIADCRCSWS